MTANRYEKNDERETREQETERNNNNNLINFTFY